MKANLDAATDFLAKKRARGLKPDPEREAMRTASSAAQVMAGGGSRFDGLEDDDG